jgi:transposase-like protein
VSAKEAEATAAELTDEFRAGAVRLVLDEGKSVSQVARDLDVHVNSVRE